MKVLSIAALLCALALTLPARAQTKNAFSGVWVLDASKSVLMDASRRDIELRVRDNGSSVRVAQPVATAKRLAEVVYECTTDGKPGEQRMSGVVYVRTLRREGRDLVWGVEMTRLADNATLKFSERWSLSADGLTLTIHRVYTATREVIQVFARKSGRTGGRT